MPGHRVLCGLLTASVLPESGGRNAKNTDMGWAEQVHSCEHGKHSLFLCYNLLNVALFSIRTVNLLLPTLYLVSYILLYSYM